MNYLPDSSSLSVSHLLLSCVHFPLSLETVSCMLSLLSLISLSWEEEKKREKIVACLFCQHNQEMIEILADKTEDFEN